MTPRKPEASPPRASRDVRLTLTEAGGKGSSVEVDGRDISALVRGVSLAARAGEITTVQLDLGPVTVHVAGEARVAVSGPTRDFLLTLGWTPPAVD